MVSFISTCRLAGLALAGLVSVAAIQPAAATVCTAFTLTEAHVAVFQNGSWQNTQFQQAGPGQFTLARNPDWPNQLSLLFRWDIVPGSHPEILPAASFAPEPVFFDYQYVGDGFGTSFGVVAQVNNITLSQGAHPAYMEFAIALPNTGCDLIRSNIATLTITPWLQIDPDTIPQLSCLPPNCGPGVRQPGAEVINPNPGRIQPQQVLPQQLLPQPQVRN